MLRNVTVGQGPATNYLVVANFDGPVKLRAVPKALREALVAAAREGECFEAVAGGLRGWGMTPKQSAKEVRQAYFEWFSRVEKAGVESVHVVGSVDAQALGETLGIAVFQPNEFKGTATKARDERSLTVSFADQAKQTLFERGLQVAESVNFSRRLSETPPNIATPDWMAEQARTLAESHGLSYAKLSGDDLIREQLTGLINVGKASENPPCMIRLEYRPEGVTGNPVVLLGKTITYDTGGLSLKTREGMVGMKYDKNGGCAVLGAMHACATWLKPKVPVVAILVAAENCISDEAYRPDDVIAYRNGVTVEVTNTDAEGRLVLADGLCWACEKDSPRAIVDMATLTGGVVVALGSIFAGAFSNDETLAEALIASGNRTGEGLWRLPVNEDYRQMMKSPIADIVNSVPGRLAHPIQGAAFLSYFVADGVKWAHLDIAGTSVGDGKGPTGKGATGFGVRLLADYLGGLKP